MPYEIVLGRTPDEKSKLGTKGSVFIGKQYVKMGSTTSLSQPVFLDLNKSHVVFVCGKRGSGKSYTMGVVSEGITQLEQKYKERLSVIMLDTMGIYWTMKYPNNPDSELLKEWGLEGKEIPIKIFCPKGMFKQYKDKGIPADKSFSINPSELNPEDWNLTFELGINDPIAVFIERIILNLQKSKDNYAIQDIIQAIESDTSEPDQVVNAALNRFKSADSWGIFSSEATSMADLAASGQITILDLSAYATMPNGWKIKHLVMGLVCIKLFQERMVVRKAEELKSVESSIHYIISEDEKKLMKEKMPLVWIMIDEAHEFLPRHGKTAATNALITLLREGRQPGISLILATQQPGKIHTDAMTQSDVILSHRLTAKIDTDALGSLMQSYLRTGLDKELNNLPKVPGACIAVDDVNERIYPIRIRPRFSWHGGSAPNLIR
ncbi:ATP-binding protein [Candidatus Woesearchaeota archaeon]|nr:ATP-binding protein [Candidatus Woesearchaeota archaeon]